MGSFVWTGLDALVHGQKSSNAIVRNLSQKYAGAAESNVDVTQPASEKPADDFSGDFGVPGVTKVPYLAFETLGLAAFTDPQGPKEEQLRQAQLEMRRTEIFETLHVLRRLNAGDAGAIASERTRSLGAVLAGRKRFDRLRTEGLVGSTTDFLSTFKGKLDVDDPALIGHSFGGATLMELLRTDQDDFMYGIVLDPWVEPVRDPSEDESVRGKLKKPLYVLNSEGFTMWGDLFARLQRILIDAQLYAPRHRGWLMTMCGTNHGDFSDLPFLLPRIFGSTVRPDEAIKMFTEASILQIKTLRQQFHRLAIEAGRIPNDIGADLDQILLGGEHINTDPTRPMTVDTGLSDLTRHPHLYKSSKRQRQGIFWELKGWRSYADHTKDKRKHHREEEKRAVKRGADSARAEKSDAQKSDARQSATADQQNDEENDPLANPVYVDPRGNPNAWQGTQLDSDARYVFEHLSVAHKIDEKRPRPYSLVTVILWYIGIRSGLAPAGHVLVHEV